MQIERDFAIELKRGVELLLLSEMTNTQLVHQRLASMESSVLEMQRVIEYAESQHVDKPIHALYLYAPQLIEQTYPEGTPEGDEGNSTIFGAWPQVRFYHHDHFHFQPRKGRATPIKAVTDLKPWATTMSDVLSDLGKPLTRGDNWALSEWFEYEIPASPDSTPERVQLTFTMELLEYLGPHRPDDADWRRYSAKSAPGK